MLVSHSETSSYRPPSPLRGGDEGGVLRPISASRAGYAIIAVLVVIVVLSLAAYRFSGSMMGEARASRRIQQAAEAKASAMSGIHYSMALVADPDALQSTLNGNPYDNSGMFHQVVVREAAEGQRQARFTIVSLDYSNADFAGQPEVRYGLTDESSKININALYFNDPATGTNKGNILRNMLMQLPNMTDEIADSILDWIDTDDTPRSAGAESQHYQGLGYRCKNGPLDSVDELLMVKGVTPLLLYGTDRNRNGVNDEGTGEDTFDPGWYPFLTVYSREALKDIDGNDRINVNGTDLKTIYNDLTTKAALNADFVSYLIAARVYTVMPAGTQAPQGAQTGTTANLNALVQQQINNTQQTTQPKKLTTVIDLVGSSIQVTSGKTTTVYPFPSTNAAALKQDFPKIMEKIKFTDDPELAGRINLNTAPKAVLMGLTTVAQQQGAVKGGGEWLTEDEVDRIVSTRPSIDQLGSAEPVFESLVWLYTEMNITPTKLKTLEPFVTGKTHVYRMQSIGYFDQSGPMVRVEAVIDANYGRPRIVYFRDLTELGRAFDFSQ